MPFPGLNALLASSAFIYASLPRHMPHAQTHGNMENAEPEVPAEKIKEKSKIHLIFSDPEQASQADLPMASNVYRA